MKNCHKGGEGRDGGGEEKKGSKFWRNVEGPAVPFTHFLSNLIEAPHNPRGTHTHTHTHTHTIRPSDCPFKAWCAR